MSKADTTIKLTRNITLAGKTVGEGETVNVSASTAKWLIEQKAAEAFKAATKSKGGKDEKDHPSAS